jgi:hypothetical protein
MDRTMRWIVFVLWLLLTPTWVSYSFLAGSGPKVAFIPPALVFVALVFTSLWKRLVVNIAGELEPSYFHPYWGAALLSRLSRGSVRTGLVAAAVGVCAGAIVALTPQERLALKNNIGLVVPQESDLLEPAPQQKPQPGSTPLPQSILAAKPLGPASQFQPPGATPAQAASGIAQQLGALPQSNKPPSNQARANQAPGNQQQVATPAQQQTAPQVSATPAPYAAIANDDDRPAASRRVRHPRKQATFTSNAPRDRDENYVPRYGPDQYGAWSGSATQRFDARDYDRVYNSYGEPRFGPDARYPRRSRVIPRSPETLYPTPRREQYWGGYRYGN